MSKSAFTFNFLLSFLVFFALGCSTPRPIASSVSTNANALNAAPGKGKIIVYRNSWIDRKAPISLYLSEEVIAHDLPAYSHVVIDLAPGNYELKVKTGDRVYRSAVSIAENDLHFFSAYVSRREGLSLDYFVMDNPRLFKVNEEVGRQSVLETSLHAQVTRNNYKEDLVVAQSKTSLPSCDKSMPTATWTNCLGELFSASGLEYVGEFKGGKRHGQGKRFYNGGNKYVGEWREDKKHGLGVYTFVGGELGGAKPFEGVWEEDRFVRAERIPDHIAERSSSTPPRVAQPPLQAEPPRPTLSISASASQPDSNGIVTLTITTNSDTASLRINGDEEGGRADGRYSLRKFAQVGDNRFEVVAVDRSGNTQSQTVTVVRQPADNIARFAALNPLSLKARPPRDAVAIIIGIQDYRRVSKADFANNDARLFYDYAIRGLGVRPENIKLLLDDKADDLEILGAFKNWLPVKTRKGQTDVYVFYSGHGYPSDDGASLYFLPHGVDRQFLDRSAIKQSDIVLALQAVVPKSVTLFLDACYSGQSRTGETLLAGARPISIQPRASTFPSNFTVLSASAPEQIASSSPDLKHGIFSYYLMKGMEGEADQNKDGAITVEEMQSYLSDSVGRKAMSLSRTQQPQVVGDQSRVLVGR